MAVAAFELHVSVDQHDLPAQRAHERPSRFVVSQIDHQLVRGVLGILLLAHVALTLPAFPFALHPRRAYRGRSSRPLAARGGGGPRRPAMPDVIAMR